MSIFSGITKSKEKENRNKALAIMLDFVNGKISADNFWKIYKNSDFMQSILIKDKNRQKGVYSFDKQQKIITFNKNSFTDSQFFYNPDNLLETIDITKLESRNALRCLIRNYFLKKNIKINHYNEFLIRIQPEWIDVKDERFLYSIVNSAPKNLSDELKEKWCNEKLKELFKFDNLPPEWAQSPEWPIIDSKPLIFSHQKTDEKNGDHEFYYFYDPITRQETIIEQWY